MANLKGKLIADLGTAAAPGITFIGAFGSGLYLSSGGHLNMNSAKNGNLRFNSKSFYVTSGTAIGFQSKPAMNVAGSSVTGAEISPRVNSGFTLSGNIIGLHVDAYLKGTADGTITGDVRGLNVELVTDDAGTRTISGNVSMIRLRSAFSGTTITGKFVAIRIEKPETQTNSKTFDALIEMPSTLGASTAAVWHDTTTSATAAGVIGVLVNGNKRYINLYSGTPS